jgi:hypothetical protein
VCQERLSQSCKKRKVLIYALGIEEERPRIDMHNVSSTRKVSNAEMHCTSPITLQNLPRGVPESREQGMN